MEKSRYVYYLQAEQRPEGAKGALVSPETRLLKQKAVQIYNRLLREYPDFHDGDKVTFYLAHEQRELGQFDEMLKTLGELIRKYPNSPLRLDAEQILGDYFFDKSDLVEAEKHYQAILDAAALAGARPGPLQDGLDPGEPGQARRGGDLLRGRRRQRAAARRGRRRRRSTSSARRCWTSSTATPRRGPPRARSTTSRSSRDSRATFALALDKLGNRYFIKQQYEYAIPALRKLMEIQPDPELDLERGQKLYDALKAAKGKVLPEPEDMRFLVRAAVQSKTDPELDETDAQEAARRAGGDGARPVHPAARGRAEEGRQGAVREGRGGLQASTSASSARSSTCGRS